VLGPGCEAKVALGDERNRPRLVANDGLSPSQLAAALAVIDEHRLLLLEQWWLLHGDD
jgi:hypothetical protein